MAVTFRKKENKKPVRVVVWWSPFTTWEKKIERLFQFCLFDSPSWYKVVRTLYPSLISLGIFALLLTCQQKNVRDLLDSLQKVAFVPFVFQLLVMF